MAKKKASRRRRASEGSVPSSVVRSDGRDERASHHPMPAEDQLLRNYFGEEECERLRKQAWGDKPLRNLNELLRLMDRRDDLEKQLELLGDGPERRGLVDQLRRVVEGIAFLRLVCEGQLNDVVWNRNRMPAIDEDRSAAEARLAIDLTTQSEIRRARTLLVNPRSLARSGKASGPSSDQPTACSPNADRQHELERLLEGRDGPRIRAVYLALPVSADGTQRESSERLTELVRSNGFCANIAASTVQRTIKKLREVLGEEIVTARDGGGGSWKTRDRLAEGG